MATTKLVTNDKDSLFGGVNQQAPQFRLGNQVEEMINCLPTVDAGLRLRNPTVGIRLNHPDGTFARIMDGQQFAEAFVFEHDRGNVGGGSYSKLVFMITEKRVDDEGREYGGLEVIDLTAVLGLDDDEEEIIVGTLYRDGDGLNYPLDDNGTAKQYIEENFGGRNGYAMTTVKDTTFVVNKSVKPAMSPETYDEDNPLRTFGDVRINLNGEPSGLNPETVEGTGADWTFKVPANVVVVSYDITAAGGGGGGGGGGSEGGDSPSPINGNGGYNDGSSRGGGAGAYSRDTHVEVRPYEDLLEPTQNIFTVHLGSGGGGGAAGNGGSSGDGHDGSDGTAGGNSTMTFESSIRPEDNISLDLVGGYYGIKGKGGEGVEGSATGATGRAGIVGKAFGGLSGTAGYGGTGGSEEDSGNIGGAGQPAGAGGGMGGGGGGGEWLSGGESGGAGNVGGAGAAYFTWTQVTAESTSYKRTGYVWIKTADVSYEGYSHSAILNIREKDGFVRPLDTIGWTTKNLDGSVDQASQLAALIHAALNFETDGTTPLVPARGTATSVGSIVHVEMSEPDVDGLFEEIVSIDAADTFGDMASFGWGHTVDYLSDLPTSMGALLPVVKVGNAKEPTIWVNYEDGSWNEYRDPDTLSLIYNTTMPHIIKRIMVEYPAESGQFRQEFVVEAYDWDRRLVGDDETNKIPSFIGSVEENVTIRDIFFYRNRLGFITNSSIIMSEIGEYGNFFRTTVAALLDSDRIDAGVESVNVVNMEHAVALEDSMILFADKAQFRFSGGEFLSPANFTIVQEMAYDMNIQVKPLFMNDRVFFVVPRGNKSAVYEMQVSNQSTLSSGANDITSHCQTYIDGAVDKLTGAAVENMLFITSLQDSLESDRRILRNTVFVYKYVDSGNVRQQSAWFKWTYDGDILSGFALAGHFYLLIDRTDVIANSPRWIMKGVDQTPEPDTSTAGRWNMSEQWNMKGIWLMSSKTADHAVVFERMQIAPRHQDLKFLDNGATNIDGYVGFGEWVYGVDGSRDPRGKLLMKTVEIFAEGHLKLWVRDNQRLSYREVPSKYAISPRKPMMYGEAKNVRVGIKNEGDTGFRIDTVSLEGSITKRATSR